MVSQHQGPFFGELIVWPWLTCGANNGSEASGAPQPGHAPWPGAIRLVTPVIFHSGHSGIGSGMRCGGGLRLQNSNPMLLEDVAIAFPDMQIVVAHPSWPWQDEAISLAMHKPNIWIDLSGWSPKYFPPQLVQYANTLLKDRILSGSDFPLITPDRWLEDGDRVSFGNVDLAVLHCPGHTPGHVVFYSAEARRAMRRAFA